MLFIFCVKIFLKVGLYVDLVNRKKGIFIRNAEKLAFLTDIEGVYKDINDPSSFISRLTCSEADALIASGNIGGGMLPKLQNCIDAMKKGVNSVHILDGRVPHCLLLEIFTNKGIGTMIEKSIDKAF